MCVVCCVLQCVHIPSGFGTTNPQEETARLRAKYQDDIAVLQATHQQIQAAAEARAAEQTKRHAEECQYVG